MKKNVLKTSLILLIAVGLSVRAQSSGGNAVSGQREVVYIHGVRFADALLEKWISEYSRQHPALSLSAEGRDGDGQSIGVVPFGLRKDAGASATVVSFGRYAVLPIAGKNNALLATLKKKKLNEKRLKELFFEKDLLEDYSPEERDKYDATIYSGNGSLSVAHSFAGHFGYETSSLKGKKIAGDDIYLNSAVRKDAKGVSFNALNYIFDLHSRQLSEGIGLLPLDVKKEYAEALGLQNLDETISLLENNRLSLVPVEEIAFVLPEKVSAAMLDFVEWALSEGQEYIHPFGFLHLDEKTLAQQRKQVTALETRLLANK
jgi:ABC-type phosphate transport system substrate-binding protein